MNDDERREVIDRLNVLAHYVRAGGSLDWREPPPRSGKRPKTEASRTLTFTVYDVRQFDQIGWDLMRRAMARRSAR